MVTDPASTPATPHLRPHHAILWALPTLLLAPLYGVWPLEGLLSLALMLPTLGTIECLADTGHLLYCPLASAGSDHAISYGLPFVVLASAVMRLASLEPLLAYQLTGLGVLGLAGWGVQGLFRALGARPAWACIGALLFLSLPIVYAKSGYPLMMWGFALMPLVLWAQVAGFRCERAWLSGVLFVVPLTLALFQEPYSFVMALTFGGWWLLTQPLNWPHIRWGRALIRSVLWVGSVAVAVALYQRYLPEGTLTDPMPLDFFRGQGIDVIAFMARHPDLFLLGPLWGVGALEPWAFFTDGEMTAHSYFGLTLLITLSLFVVWFKWWREQPALAVVLTLVGALAMALGPSLKVNDRIAVEANGPPEVSQYMMPPEQTTLTLPHHILYTWPPFKHMRSVSRWYLMVALMAVLMAVWVVQRLAQTPGWGRPAAVALGVLALVEYAPNVDNRLARASIFGAQYDRLETELIGELRSLVGGESGVMFVSGERLKNEYFTTYLCARVGCTTFNASTDKALEAAIARWPEARREAIMTAASARARATLLHTDTIQALIIPHFDMRWNSYTWPPDEATRQTMIETWVRPYRALDCALVTTGTWFSVIRAASTPCTAPASDGAHHSSRVGSTP